MCIRDSLFVPIKVFKDISTDYKAIQNLVKRLNDGRVELIHVCLLYTSQIALHKEIQKLPPKQRTVFTMRYFDEVKYEDMVEILGGTEGSLKASYHHAYNKIKENLKHQF